jgi:hypothetical protein
LLAQSEHILPVLTVKLEAATASGEPVQFVVKLFDGEDPARMAREASEAVGLNSTQADKVVNSVTRKAVEARLIPAVRLKLQDGDEERIFEVRYHDHTHYPPARLSRRAVFFPFHKRRASGSIAWSYFYSCSNLHLSLIILLLV